MTTKHSFCFIDVQKVTFFVWFLGSKRGMAISAMDVSAASGKIAPGSWSWSGLQQTQSQDLLWNLLFSDFWIDYIHISHEIVCIYHSLFSHFLSFPRIFSHSLASFHIFSKNLTKINDVTGATFVSLGISENCEKRDHDHECWRTRKAGTHKKMSVVAVVEEYHPADNLVQGSIFHLCCAICAKSLTEYWKV